METLYLCGAGNPEGVRLALAINNVHKRWDRIVILDDDASKHGKKILGIEVAGPFSLLGQANPATDEVSNMVARTVKVRQAACRKIEQYGLPFATLVAPDVDIEWVDLGRGITVYRNSLFCANATVGEGSVIFGSTVIGHGCRLGKGCIIAPGAVINARVELGDGVYVGTNASIMPELKIGHEAVIGANSAVIQDVPAGASVMGVPARILMQRTVAPGPGTSRYSRQEAFESPATEIERKLAALWMKTLKVERVGRNDNFFELGGSSIDAVSLFVEIEQMCQIRLPLSILLQAPTLRQLAGFIQEDVQKPDWSSLVPLREGGNMPPLFLVHGAEGNILLYRELTRYLREDQPVYGLQSQGLDGSGHFLTTVEEMASCYVREIRGLQSKGPFFLGGYCLGGIIALEMARQLRAEGEEVALVGMIETYNVSLNPIRQSHLLSLFHMLQNVRYHLGNLLSLGMSDRLKFLNKKLSVEKGRLAIRFASWGNMRRRGEGGDGDLYPHLAITQANEQAATEYVPRDYSGRVVVFRPKVHFLGQNDPEFGWGEVVRDGLAICNLPIYPKAMLVEPFVRNLAEEFNRFLGQALASAGR